MMLKLAMLLINIMVLVGKSDAQKYRSWYQEGATLTVEEGALTVKLPSENCSPISINADAKSIVQLNKGFARIPSLKRLSLEANTITTLNVDSLFEGLPELEYLSLARNRISTVHVNTFRGLNKLKVLNLENNQLKGTISFWLDDKTLPALTHLYLYNNALSGSITSTSMLCNANLEHLYLSSNSITSFNVKSSNDDPQYSCMKRLTHLFIEDNNLAVFELGKSDTLETLSLYGNRFTRIPAFPSGVKFLSLGKNSINRIGYLDNAENLLHLELSYNTITDLSSYENLEKFSSLEHLAIDFNFVDPIPNGFIRNLTSLKSVSLTRYTNGKIAPQAFADLPELQEISILSN